MKKILYTLIVVSLSLTACNKYLDVKPVDRILETSVFNDQKSIHTALNGIYLRMAKPNLYGGKMTMQTIDILAQYYNVGAAHRFTQLFNYRYSEQIVQSEFEAIWKSSYATMLNVNNFIDKLRETESIVSDLDKKLMMGEAIGLRAFLHFDMLRLFGPIFSQDPNRESIPYVDQATARTEQLLPAEEIIRKIIKDIHEATVLLEGDPVRNVGVQAMIDGGKDNFFRMRNRRFNYYALKLLQARVQLYAGKKEEAYNTAIDVLNEIDEFFPWTDPRTVIANPNSPDRIFSPEIIFGIENDELYKQHDLIFNPVLTSNEILVPSKAALDRVFENNASDYRFYSWVTPSVGNYDRVFVKFQDVQDRNMSSRYLQPLMRKSELYLILAETAQTDQEALTYLNTLRNHRGLASMIQLTDKRANIDSEFMKEFYGEGQLFFYNKRLAKTSVPNPANNSTKSIALSSYIIPLPLSETNNR